jgi:hypothetical protein
MFDSLVCFTEALASVNEPMHVMLLPCDGLLSDLLDEPCVGDDSFDLKNAYMISMMNWNQLTV